MDINVKRNLAAASAAVMLGAGLATGIVSSATAGEISEPCAKEQAQVDKAAAKLEDLQAVFLKSKKELRQAEKALEKADSKKDKSQAEDAVEEAEDDVADTGKAKKAQVKRLEKAQGRLDACLSEVPTEPPTEDPAEDPAGEN